MVNQTTTRGIEIKMEQLHKSFGKNEVLKSVDITIDSGQFVAIVGKSGSGKSTLLRLVAGLESQAGGNYFMKMRHSKKQKQV